MADSNLTTSTRRAHGTRWAVLVTVLLAAAYSTYWWFQRADPSRFITAEVTRGPIVRAVTATGTVNPVTVVQVGTYVSGPISQIYADFNSAVKAGQLLAKIDPRPFQAQVALSKGALANARAQLVKDQANLVYQKITTLRDAELLKQAVVAQATVDSQVSTDDQAKAQILLDQAAIQQQQASLEAAELNLYYTNIISPVDGTVVSRNVDRGQTVAASYQTPTLFLVAKDLTKMQVDTNVSESDVGGVRVHQPVDFTVDAYPAKVFEGNVAQVREAPITVQNVVTYDVVAAVPNPELLLMPGMTATITIVTERRDDVLRVPLRALSFSPRHRASNWSAEGSLHQENHTRVWLAEGGRIRPVRVVRGIDDGDNVEVISGPLQPGDNIVTGELQPHESEPGGLASAHGPGFHLPHM
jgi:HlyD family secretion protein